MSLVELAFTIATSTPDAGSWADPPIVRFVGRLHPLFVHFPIGLILVACCAELAHTVFRRSLKPSTFALQCLAVGAVSALVACGAGWINAEAESHSASQADLVNLHRWIGIAAASLAVVTVSIGALARRRDARIATNAYRAALLLGTACVGLGGHLGGELVYGKGYVFAVFQTAASDEPGRVPRIEPDASVVRTVDFDTQIRPILDAACVHCHGESRAKAGLRMHTLADLFADEEEFWVVKPGTPDESELYARIVLPGDDLDLMPADGDRLPQESIDLIRTWIAEGAQPSPSTPRANDAIAAGTASTGPAESTNDGTDAAAPDAVGNATVRVNPDDPFGIPILTDGERSSYNRAIESLRSMGVRAAPVAATTDALDVNLSIMPRPARNDDLALMAGLETTLVWLNLAGAEIDDVGAARLADFTQLRRLHLENSKVTDASMDAIASLPNLEYLNLYGTAVSDLALTRLADAPSLTQLYLWQTAVSPEAVAALRAARPDLDIIAGRTQLSDGVDESGGGSDDDGGGESDDAPDRASDDASDDASDTDEDGDSGVDSRVDSDDGDSPASGT